MYKERTQKEKRRREKLIENSIRKEREEGGGEGTH